MKKRVLALLLCVSTAISMTGCGSKGESVEATEAVENTESTEEVPAVPLAQYDLKGSDYVTLCDYSAIPVTISGDYDVTDQDVLDYVEKIFTQGGPFYTADPDKTTVEEGDIVNVDYVGKLDGEAFSGGTAEDQNIDVSNNSSTSGSAYIDGFTDGLIGASVGDVIDSNVTFPDEYPNNPDLAGKEVVFTFTVNSIQKEVTMDTMDDEFASEQFGVDSVDGVYEQVRQYLESSAESTHKNDIYSALEDYLLENCTVDMPADYRSDVIEAIRANFIDRYCSGDESQMETVLSSYGYTEESIEQEWSDSVESSIRLELIVKAIAEKEDIQIDDTEFEDYVSTIVSSGGFGDADTLYSNYGYGDSVYGKNQIRVIYLAGLVLDKLAETAEVTENAVEETTESVESTESADSTEE
ncbi:trigger factor [Roseburia inulinivorans]